MDPLPKNFSQSGPSYRRYAHTFDPFLAKPKNRAYTATILSFLVISLFLWYAIRPTVQTILSLRREIRDNLEVNQQMEEKISDLVQAQAVYQTASSRLPMLSQALPKNPDVVALLMSLREIASQANASLSGIQIGAVPIDTKEATAAGQGQGQGQATNDTIYFSPITVSIDGTYATIKNFLDMVLTMRRIVIIDSYAINHIGDDKTIRIAGPDLRLTMKFNVQYYPGAPYER